MFTPNENEKIICVVRRYGPTHAGPIAVSFLFLSAAFFFMFWLFRHGVIGQIAFIVLLAAGLLVFFREMLVHFRNVFYVTDCRVVDIEWRSLFHCVVSDIPYDQIEDVSGHIRGFWGLMFQYGNVTIQTGGGSVRVIADRVRRPVALQHLINTMRQQSMAPGRHRAREEV